MMTSYWVTPSGVRTPLKVSMGFPTKSWTKSFTFMPRYAINRHACEITEGCCVNADSRCASHALRDGRRLVTSFLDSFCVIRFKYMVAAPLIGISPSVREVTTTTDFDPDKERRVSWSVLDRSSITTKLGACSQLI